MTKDIPCAGMCSQLDDVAFFIRKDHAHVQPLLDDLRDLLPLSSIRGRVIERQAVDGFFIIHLADDLAQLEGKRLFASAVDPLHVDDPSLSFMMGLDDPFVLFIFPAMSVMCLAYQAEIGSFLF